mmetsp:Transcript_30588/g.79432  ORF Transcript_30588/g.79432 Transcript_30588/m.79432 type:complete len:732 (-) Transcript_30588:437-2632(-)
MAWSSWHEQWAAKRYALMLLRQAANHLHSPDLARGFEHWFEYAMGAKEQAAWIAQQQRENSMLKEQGTLTMKVETMQAMYEQKLKDAEESKLLALERLRVELVGSAEERHKLREEKTKENRIQEVQAKWARRLMHQGVAHGWNAWVEAWEARLYALSWMRRAANQFQAPDLAMGFEAWENYIRLCKESKAKAHNLKLMSTCETLNGQLQSVMDESERKLKEASEERKLLLREIRQLKGGAADAEAKTADALEQERAERVEATKRQIARRMMSRELSRGWTAWHASWEERVYMRHLMMTASKRLRMPELAQGFHAWQQVIEDSRRAAAVTKLKDRAARRASELENELRQLRFEMGQVDMVRAARDDELNALRDRAKNLSDEVAAKTVSLMEMEELRKHHGEMLEAFKTKQAEASASQQSLRQAQEDAARQRISNQDLLERLLAEQRKTFEVELEENRREAELAVRARDIMEHDLHAQKGEFMQELNTLRSHLERAEGNDAILNERITAFEKENSELNSVLKFQRKRGTDLEEELSKVRREAASLQKQLEEEAGAMKRKILRLEELTKPPPPAPSPVKRATAPRKSKGPLGDFDLDEGPDAPPISEQIKRALQKNAAKVLDLFRSWDDNGDGQVTRAEFHKAMTTLGLEVPASSVDELFDQWDSDGGGEIGLKEMTKILRQSMSKSSSPGVQSAGKAIQKQQQAIKAVSAIKSAGAESAAGALAAKLAQGKKS